VLLETFLLVGALRIIKAARVAAVVSGKSAALRIHLETKRVAAAFGEYFKAFRLGMISPNELAQKMNRFGVGTVHAGPDNISSGCAAARAIKPSVRTPAQTVGDGMRVFQTEASQQHSGRTVWHVI